MTVRLGHRGVTVVAGFSLICALTASLPAQTMPAPAAAPGDPPAEPELDPNAPLADLPDLGVAWPDLSKAPAEAADPAARTAGADDLRYGYRLEGIDAVATPLLRQRFADLSALKANDGKPANAAQIDRRAREDAELLTTLLRGEGYYDAQVTTAVASEDARVVVTLTAEPGVQYRFDRVTLAGVDAAGGKSDALTDAFGVADDAPVNADAIATGETRLKTEVGRQGFAFGQVGEPEIVVDRAAKTATLDLSVRPGRAQRFGRVTMAREKVFGPRHVEEIARFRPGQPYEDRKSVV